MKHRIWHVAYARWYDHREAGHPRRAAVWGWVADRLCAALWPDDADALAAAQAGWGPTLRLAWRRATLR